MSASASSRAGHSNSSKSSSWRRMTLLPPWSSFSASSSGNQAAGKMHGFPRTPSWPRPTSLSGWRRKNSTSAFTVSLVGQTVTLPVYDKEGKLVGEKEGVVTGTGLYNGQRVIFIGDETYLLNQIMAVGKLPAKKPEEGDETEKPGEDGSVDKPEGPGEGESVEKPGEGEATPPETGEGGAGEETLEKALG